MRVLVVNVHFAPESLGGATLVAEQTATRLRSRGIQVIAVTGMPHPRLDHGQMFRYTVHGLPVVAVGHGDGRGTAEEAYHRPELGDRMRQILDAVRPDVVHFHAIQGLGVEMVTAVQEAGLPTVVSLHDAWWLCERQFMLRESGIWCEQTAIDARVCATCVQEPSRHEARQMQSLRILNSCDRVLTPSQYWYDLMHDSGICERVLQVNRNGVIHPAVGFRRTPHSGPIRFAYVGGNHHVKGFEQLRGAFLQIDSPDYRLRLVDASLALGFQAIHPREWELPGEVELVRGYSLNDLDRFFDDIDVLIFPSQSPESYGLTVREAVLRGVWVIATDGGGPAEVLVDGVNATLVPMGPANEPLASAIRAAIEHPDAFRNRARRVAPIPTFDDQATELLNIYGAVLAERGGRRTRGADPSSAQGSWSA